MKIDLEHCILVVDEAHNLPDRIRNGLERRAIMKIFRDSRLEIDEYLGSKEQEIKKLDLSELKDNNDIYSIKQALRQMTKLEKQMKIWYKMKENDLVKSGKKDMKIPTIDFIGEIDSILKEELNIEINNNYSILKELIIQLRRVKVDQDNDDDEKETASTRLAELLAITLEYLHNMCLNNWN